MMVAAIIVAGGVLTFGTGFYAAFLVQNLIDDFDRYPPEFDDTQYILRNGPRPPERDHGWPQRSG
jgi:hypothetical protein